MIESVQDWRWLLFLLLAAAAFSDIRSMKIPNTLPLGIALSTALILFAGNAAPADYATASSSGLIGLGVGYAFYALGMMGAGDGKLFAAAATWFSTGALLSVSLWVSLAGVIVAFAVLAVRTLRKLNSTDPLSGVMKAALKAPMPYGVAIAVGFAAAAQQSAAG